MAAATIVSDLFKRDIRLRLDVDGTIKASGKPGALTPADRRVIDDNRAELVAYLRRHAPVEPPPPVVPPPKPIPNGQAGAWPAPSAAEGSEVKGGPPKVVNSRPETLVQARWLEKHRGQRIRVVISVGDAPLAGTLLASDIYCLLIKTDAAEEVIVFKSAIAVLSPAPPPKTEGA